MVKVPTPKCCSSTVIFGAYVGARAKEVGDKYIRRTAATTVHYASDCPEVILMDEPYSVLDPLATAKIEELIGSFKQNSACAIVTGNVQQNAGKSIRAHCFSFSGRAYRI